MSLRFTTMIWSSTWAWTVGLWIGTSVSTRHSMLRAIQSAELMYTRACRLGSTWPLPNTQMRLCSRKRPTMDFTRMLSDRPGTPGRRQQMPRTTMQSICTPAREAAYRRSISRSSTRLFILSQMLRGLAGAGEADFGGRSIPFSTARMVSGLNAKRVHAFGAGVAGHVVEQAGGVARRGRDRR